MDGDGHATAARLLPHRVKAPVINLEERPLPHALAQVKPERLCHLQTVRADLPRATNLLGLKRRVIGLRDARVPRLSEDEKALRVGRPQLADGLLQRLAVPARQVHHRAHVLPPDHRQHVSGSRVGVRVLRLAETSRPRQVCVEVYRREACALHPVRWYTQHALRLVIFECQSPWTLWARLPAPLTRRTDVCSGGHLPQPRQRDTHQQTPSAQTPHHVLPPLAISLWPYPSLFGHETNRII